MVNCKDLLQGLILSEPICEKLLHSTHAPLTKFRFKENRTKFSGLVPGLVTVKQKGEVMAKTAPVDMVSLLVIRCV